MAVTSCLKSSTNLSSVFLPGIPDAHTPSAIRSTRSTTYLKPHSVKLGPGKLGVSGSGSFKKSTCHCTYLNRYRCHCRRQLVNHALRLTTSDSVTSSLDNSSRSRPQRMSNFPRRITFWSPWRDLSAAPMRKTRIARKIFKFARVDLVAASK